jgi:hypothetical protein
MMEQPPKARPRPLTRQAYLEDLKADVAEARRRGYGNAQIAEALSLDRETAKALDLGLDELPVIERAVRRGHGGAEVESASLKARKPAKAGDARVRRPAQPERHADQGPVQARGETAGSAKTSVSSPALADPVVDRGPSTAAGSSGSAARPVDGRDAARAQPPATANNVTAPATAQPTAGSPAPASRAVPPTEPLGPAAKHQAEKAALLGVARGFHDRVVSTDPAHAASTKPSGDRRPDPASGLRGTDQATMF